MADIEPSAMADLEPSAMADIEPSGMADLEPSGMADIEPSAMADVDTLGAAARTARLIGVLIRNARPASACRRPDTEAQP